MKKYSVLMMTATCLLGTTLYAQVPGIINYQGRVVDAGTNFNGTGLFKFALVNAAGATNYWSNDGTAVGQPAATVSLNVTKGLYSVLLGDTTLSNMTTITPVVFANSDVRLRVWFNDGVNGSQQLSPDQRLGAVGYALNAASFASGGDVLGARLNIGVSNTLSGAYATIAGGSNNATALGAIGGGQNNTANGNDAVIGGGLGNTATGLGATVGGGVNNSAGTQGATVDGGANNMANNLWSTVGGGEDNTASGQNSTVAGGIDNTASGTGAFVGGGGTDGGLFRGNLASGVASTVGGGVRNTNSATYGTIGGGLYNSASGPWATVGGGSNNTASGLGATIAGGGYGVASGSAATVGGGEQNTASGPWATVGAGLYNSASGTGSFIGGGGYDGFSFGGNAASGAASVIGGGIRNIVSNSYTTVGGGNQNTASGANATVSGGTQNTASGIDATVAGGNLNTASGLVSTVGGGQINVASGEESTIPGGVNNVAAGDWSFAAGQEAQALHQGAFVWADSQIATFASTANDQFLIRAQGGVGIGTNDTAGVQLYVSTVNHGSAGNTAIFSAPNIGPDSSYIHYGATGDWYIRSAKNTGKVLIEDNGGKVGIGTASPDATLSVNGTADKPGGGSWSTFSDVRLKKNVEPLRGALDRLLELRAVTFEYKDPQSIHELPGMQIGMVAQEVEKVFPDWVDTAPNGMRRLSIHGFEALTVEALRELREEKDARLAEQQRQVTELRQQNASLASRLADLESKLQKLNEQVEQSKAAPQQATNIRELGGM
jgi:hypothetical protein